MAKFNIKNLFVGKKKYVTIGAIALVVILALWMNSRKGSSGSSAANIAGVTDPNQIAAGAAAPGLTISDVQAAIQGYAEQDEERTQKQFETVYESMNKMGTSFTEALNKSNTSFTDALTKMNETNAKQFEAINSSLADINDHSAQWQTNLMAQLQAQMASMAASYSRNYSSYNTSDNYSSGSSSSGYYYSTQPGNSSQAAKNEINNSSQYSQQNKDYVNNVISVGSGTSLKEVADIGARNEQRLNEVRDILKNNPPKFQL